MMSNRHFSLLCGLSLAASLLTHPLAGQRMAELVGDDVDLFLSLRSPAETRATWAEHPFAEALRDPELAAIFEPLKERFLDAGSEAPTEVLENEFGLTWDEFFERFSGEWAMAIYNLPELVTNAADRPDFVLLVEHEGDAEELHALMQVQFERNAEAHRERNPQAEHEWVEDQFMGETLYFDEVFDGSSTYVEDGYALVDGIFVLATPEPLLRTAVEAIKLGPDDPLADDLSFAQARGMSERSDVSLHLNLQAFLPELEDALTEWVMANGAAMFGVNPDGLSQALGFSAMQAAFVDVALIEDGLSSHSGLLYEEKEGLLTLLAYSDAPLPRARFVPDSVVSTSVTGFDVARFFRQLERLLTTASPLLQPQIDAQLQTLRRRTGVDLRTAVLENLGSEIVALSRIPEEGQPVGALAEPPQVYTITLNDAVVFSSALEAFKDQVPGLRGQIQTQEFAGETIFYVEPPAGSGGGPTSSYVITRDRLIISTGPLALLREVLDNLAEGTDGFWQQAGIASAFERVAGDGTVSRSYLDLEAFSSTLFKAFMAIGRLSGDNASAEATDLPDDFEFPFRAVTEGNETGSGIFSRSLIYREE